MSMSNKEMQQRKNCHLYAYVLTALNQEVPEHIEECIETFEYPVECMQELFALLEGMREEEFNSIIKNADTPEAKELKQWFYMHKEANVLSDSITKTCL